LAFDRWRIEDLKREFDAIGCRVPLEPFGQGFRDMSRAVDAVERLVDQGRIRHGGHPVLQMCCLNATTVMDPAKNRKFDKSKSGGHIDALVALSMALAVVGKGKPEIDIEALIA
jgi:phage terminase large subunit-like protein